MEGRDTTGLIGTVSLGTAVLMWAVGYAGRFPGVEAPPWVLGLLLLALTAAGGVVAGSWGRGVRDGALVGLAIWGVNLLMLGSLLGGERPGSLRPAAPVFVAGALLAGLVLGAAGGWAGGRLGLWKPAAPWGHLLLLVAAAATFLLILAGGVVTSTNAGLAVVDWPNSYGYNMFLYPLSRMTGGIYYEHAHRLLGSLVGLTVLFTALYVASRDRRSPVKRLVWAAFLLVVIQGIMGGLRVTGRFTLAQDPGFMRPSLVLAALHGITGQIVLAVITACAVVSSPAYPAPRHPTRRRCGLASALPLMLAVQLALGAVQRHFQVGLHLHMAMAAVVATVGIVVGTRATTFPEGSPRRRLGWLFLVLLVVQIMLGFAALAATAATSPDASPLPWQTAFTTAHQGVGALLLAVAVALAVWWWPSREAPSPAAGGFGDQRPGS